MVLGEKLAMGAEDLLGEDHEPPATLAGHARPLSDLLELAYCMTPAQLLLKDIKEVIGRITV